MRSKFLNFSSKKLLVAGQNANATALLHAAQIFLGLTHVGVDLVHALLNAVELL
jgi:hypothetical protein